MALASLPRPDDEVREDDEDSQEPGGKMSFLEHLDELRSRLIKALAAVLGGFLIALIFIDEIVAFIMRPLTAVVPGGKMIYTEATEPFFLWMKMAALAGLILALPVVLWQTWRFIAPGLYAHEKRLAIPFVFFSTVFFVAGALFSHYIVFPVAWTFFAGFSSDFLEFTPRIAPVFSLYVRLLLALGAVFELPTLIFFLSRIGLVTPRFLIKNIKYAILIIFIAAAILTPTPDPVTQALVAGPMVVLYGVSILIAWAFQRKPPS
jgi:sec-independent protein translocase protein TatC